MRSASGRDPCARGPDFGRYDRRPVAMSSYLEAQSPRLPDLRVLASELPGQVTGFHSEEPSDGLTKSSTHDSLITRAADAQMGTRWQAKYGRDPADQQRSWLVNKIRPDTARKGITGKLNFERPGHDQEPPEHARQVSSAHGSEKEEGA